MVNFMSCEFYLNCVKKKKATPGYYFVPIRLARGIGLMAARVSQPGCGESGPLVHCSQECKWEHLQESDLVTRQHLSQAHGL